MRIVKDGSRASTPSASSPARVGKQTPVFSADMKMIVFQPRWNVPEIDQGERSCGRACARGGTSFGRQGLRCRATAATSIRKASTGARPTSAITTSISRRGRATCWATLKFAFPNKHAVYMHDTPPRGCSRKPAGALQPRLHARAQSRDAGGDPAGRGQGLGRGAHRRPDRRTDRRTTRWRSTTRSACTSPTSRRGSTTRASCKHARDVYGHEKRITQALEGSGPRSPRGRTIWRRCARPKASPTPAAASRASTIWSRRCSAASRACSGPVEFARETHSPRSWTRR